LHAVVFSSEPVLQVVDLALAPVIVAQLVHLKALMYCPAGHVAVQVSATPQ
jgi:hypothetical protein